MRRKIELDGRTVFGLALILSFVMGWSFAHCQTFSFPTNTPNLTVYWTHTNPEGEPITFRLYANGSVVWSGAQKETTLARSVFAVDNLLYVTASDTVSNESEPSPTITLTFTPVEEPPEEPAEFDTFPLVCDSLDLFGWDRISGNIVSGRYAWQYGGGLVFWGADVNAVMARDVVSETARTVNVSVVARVPYYGDPGTLRLSVNNPERSATVTGTAWKTYDLGAFQLEQGQNVVQVRAVGANFCVRSVSLVPVDADVTAPLAPGQPGIR
jgi:hypothetical protein